jgi:hypothetical protein
MNILGYIPRLHITNEYTRYLHPPSTRAPAMSPYIPRLIFYITPILAASKTGYIQITDTSHSTTPIQRHVVAGATAIALTLAGSSHVWNPIDEVVSGR